MPKLLPCSWLVLTRQHFCKTSLSKMTTVSRFSRQNDAGLRALNVALWENLVLVVVLVEHMLIQRKEGNIGWWAKARKSLNSWLDIDARPSRSVGRDSASWSTSTVFGWSFRNVLEKVPRNYFFLKTHFISRRPSGVAIVWMYKGVKGWAETIQTKVTKTQGCETMQLAGNWLFPRKWWTSIWGSHS